MDKHTAEILVHVKTAQQAMFDAFMLIPKSDMSGDEKLKFANAMTALGVLGQALEDKMGLERASTRKEVMAKVGEK